MDKTQPSQIKMSRRLRTILNMLDTGMIALSDDLGLEAANKPAWELFDCHGFEELALQWPTVKQALSEALDESGKIRALEGPLDIVLATPGGPRRLRLEVYPLEEDHGEPLLLLVRDLDLIEALELDLDMAARFRAISRLYSSMAHDLRAPLNALAINLDLLKSSMAKNQPADPIGAERQQRYLKVLGEELAHLTRSLSTFLTQTLPAHEVEQVFDPHEVLLDLVALIAPMAKKQRVALDLQMGDHAVMLEGRRDALKQALLNLAMNAFEAMPQGGRLTIKLETGLGEALVSFQDTGTGIPLDLAERIWEMHFSTKKTGNGIGLYVSRSTIEGFGGAIGLDASVGQGARFVISLPISKKEAA